MRKLLGFVFIAGFLLGCSASSTTAQQNHEAAVTGYVVAKVRPWLADPVVVEAVKAQNLQNAKLAADEINKLDNACIGRSAKRAH